MRYLNPIVVVPYLVTNKDGATERALSRFRFNGDVDRRRLRRMIRRSLNKAGMRPTRAYLDAVIRHNLYI